MIPFGLDINSAASNTAGFFNNAGITIGGDSGGLDAQADFTSSASANKAGTPATRQLAGGVNALNDPPFFNDVGVIESDNVLYYALGAIVGLAILAWVAFKK